MMSQSWCLSASKNKRGLTLVEIMMAMAIGSLVMLATYSLFRFVMDQSLRTERKYDQISAQYSGNIALMNDVGAAYPSFNNLYDVPEDLPSTREFFEYRNDQICDPVLDPTCKRTLTLTSGPNEGNSSRSLIMMLADDEGGPPQLINPTMFYISSVATDPDEPGPLNYSAMNLGTLMRKLPYTDPVNPGVNRAPAMFVQDSMLMFYSPVYLSPLPTCTSSVGSGARQYAHFVRVKVPATGAVEPITGVGGIPMSSTPGYNTAKIRYADPSCPSVNIVNLDTFFRKLPPLGGGAAVVNVRKIKIVRYMVNTVYYRNRISRQLVRREYDPQAAQFVREQVLALPIKEVQFTRETVSLPTIRVHIERESDGG